MNSTDNLDAVVSMIMVNLPFPPMPIMVCRGGHREDASCSSHDLLSQAISCSIIECWNEIDTNLKSSEKQQGKMQVLLDLNHANATFHEQRVEIMDQDNSGKHLDADKTQAMYELFGSFFRSYMAYYPGDSDIRFLPIDSVDVNTTIHKQAIHHIRAKRYNVSDASEINPLMTYKQIIELYSTELHLENKD